MLVAGLQRRLDFGGAAHRFDCAGKLGEDRIAGGIENPSMVLLEHRLENLAMPAQGAHGCFLALPHQPAVTGDVGGENGRESTLQGGRRFPGACFVGHGLGSANEVGVRGARFYAGGAQAC